MGQTISSSIRLRSSTLLKKSAHLCKITSLFIISILVLASCSSQAPQQKVVKVTTIPEDLSKQALNAEQTLALAKKAIVDDIRDENDASNTDIVDEKINQSTQNLIKASELYLQETNYSKAIWLAEQTLQLNSSSTIEDDDLQSLHNTQTIPLMLVKAKSYQALNYTELSYQELEAISSLAQQHNLPLNFEYYQLRSIVLQAKNSAIASLEASLHAHALNTQENEDAIEEATLLVWNKIKMLSPWQVDLLTKKTAPNLNGWLRLNQYANKFGSNAQQLSRYITQWQRQYPNHPANNIAIQLLDQNLTQETIENIAIILPLTGSNKNAGLAVQQGILAGFEQDNLKSKTAKALHFFDSNIVDWQGLPAVFAEQEIDFVIGPLLKSHLDKYLELYPKPKETDQAYINQSAVNQVEDNQATVKLNPLDIKSNVEDPLNKELSIDLTTLLLNIPNQQKLLVNQVAFSMRPEDEAVQAAATLSQIGFKQAIVLSHQDNVSKRIALAFVEQWQERTGQLLEIVYFEQGKAMQNNLKSSLDVNASQSRIDELQSRLKQTIKAQTRNRRDVDMVYVVGSAEQTRLVKPYIDVNISPFSALIPIYASSRSHSIKNDASSANDLKGLTFTEIPWLIESENQHKNLAKLSTQLWPKRNDSLSRIFAMGFDSYNLVNKLNLMQQAPYIRHFGQTGVLQLNNNILTRSLIWGRYQQKGVSQIIVD